MSGEGVISGPRWPRIRSLYRRAFPYSVADAGVPGWGDGGSETLIEDDDMGGAIDV